MKYFWEVGTLRRRGKNFYAKTWATIEEGGRIPTWVALVNQYSLDEHAEVFNQICAV